MACICDNASAPIRVLADGGALELELVARELAPAEDHRHVQFRGEWSREPAPGCASRRRLPSPGARLHLVYPYRFTIFLNNTAIIISQIALQSLGTQLH